MKKTFLRTISLLLACVLCLFGAASCGNKSGKTLMTLNKDGTKVTLSVNIYELMLSRMKGVLYASDITHNGLDVSYDAFWDYQDTFDEKKGLQTIDAFYSELILENCKTYLAIKYLFEKNVGKLSATDENAIDKIMDELLQTDGDGSKTKLNAVLSSYGVNYDILREAYELDYQTAALKNALYGENASLIGDIQKNTYLFENFVRFRQIFFATYHYVYEKDENGDEIYYYPEDSEFAGDICYDTVNGVRKYKEDGTVITDENGDKIYYYPSDSEKEGRICYDTVNGVRSVSMKDSTEETVPMSDTEKNEVYNTMLAKYSELATATDAIFEAEIIKHEQETGNSSYDMTYDDGYYLSKNIDYTSLGFSYMAEIIKKLDSMEVGDVAWVESDQGYHLIKKYAPTQNAFDKEENQDYFYNDYFDFTEDMTEQLLLDECEKLYPDIVISEKVLAAAPTIRKVAINGIYTYY